MGIEPLLAALGGDAEDDVRKIEAEAAATAARMRSEAEAQVAERCAEAVQSHERELRSVIDGRRAHALRQSRTALLKAREAFLDRVFAAVEVKLPGVLLQPQHKAALALLVSEALEYVPPGATVACRPELTAHLDASALGNARLHSDPDIAEGIVVAAADRSVRVDNTLRNRLRWMRSVLSIELVKQFEVER
jgi:vacuolar-type H+-ATPase subunit E/Vma4